MFFRDVYGYVVCVCLYVDDIFSQWGGSDFEMDSQQLMGHPFQEISSTRVIESIMFHRSISFQYMEPQDGGLVQMMFLFNFR